MTDYRAALAQALTRVRAKIDAACDLAIALQRKPEHYRRSLGQRYRKRNGGKI